MVRGRQVILPALICLTAPSFAVVQRVEGRFYPEKENYLLGEPIFIVFELVNRGPAPVSIEGSRLQGPCMGEEQIEVPNADPIRMRTFWGCYAGVGGDCASGTISLHAGAKFQDRILLNRWYEFKYAGDYDVRATRSMPIGLDDSEPLWFSANTEFFSEFRIRLEPGSEAELEERFQPYVRNLNSNDWLPREEAVDAITRMGPVFLENAILELAKSSHSMDRAAAIEGLARLDTPAAREALASFAENSKEDGTINETINAIVQTGARDYFSLLVRLDEHLHGPGQCWAIEAAGIVGGEVALPFLTSLLSTSDASIRSPAVHALGLTGSRAAVAPCIGMLFDSESSVRQEAVLSLAELTHRSASPNLWNAPLQADDWLRWVTWWARSGGSAEIYSPDVCAQPEPLN